MEQLIGSVGHGWTNRTWKRETAVMLLFVWVVLTFVVTWPGNSDGYRASVLGFYTTITGAIFVFAGGAFGLDCYFKQVKSGKEQA